MQEKDWKMNSIPNEEITMRKYYAKSTEVDFSKMTRLEVPEMCQ